MTLTVIICDFVRKKARIVCMMEINVKTQSPIQMLTFWKVEIKIILLLLK